MNAPIKYTSEQVYARLLQHPSMKNRDTLPPSLAEFISWEPQKQQENLLAFRHLNPGIWMESMMGRKIVGTKTVVDREGRSEWDRITHEEIVWGEPLDIK